MSILSDIDIRNLCVLPTKEEFDARSPFGSVLGAVSKPFVPMIEPFVPHQVKTGPKFKLIEEMGVFKSVPDGEEKIVSYGTSSYGYDLRCGRKFKIFTNVLSTVLDPKDFHPNSFVDFEGDVCIIPPNSFVLCASLERIKMPRDVTGVVLGKCLAGNTLITDPETGEIRQIADTVNQNKLLTLDSKDNKIKPNNTEGLINNGILPMYTINTRTGCFITATGTHPFLTWDGWKPLEELREGDRIAISRREPFVGKNHIPAHEARLLGFMTADGACNESTPVFTKYEQLVKDVFIKDAVEMGFQYTEQRPGMIRLVNGHTKGGGNGKGPLRNNASLWLETHGLKTTSKFKQVVKAIQTGTEEVVTNYLSALFTCDGSIYFTKNSPTNAFLEYYTTSLLMAEQLRIMLKRLGLFFFLSKQIKKLNEKEFDIYILRTTTRDTIKRFHEKIGMIKGSRKDILLTEWYKTNSFDVKSNWDTLPSKAWIDLDRIMNRLNRSYLSIGVHRSYEQSVPIKPFYDLAQETKDPELLAITNNDVIWDKIKYISKSLDQPAYDHTVPSVHNFIANGIIVHNSTYARIGISCLATPLEAGWEGWVTLEFCNTTPLPAKLYANEGCCQVLFFKGLSECLTSYSDRDGKYNRQEQGPVTAKV